MMNGTLQFAQLVKQLRLQRGLSHDQLARAAHLSRVYVYHLESGLRQNPSARVVKQLARALLLPQHERRQLYAAFTRLTGRTIDEEALELPLGQMHALAHQLVVQSTYPTHALDPLWYVRHWNQAALDLFEIVGDQGNAERLHLVELVFGAHRSRFLSWERLAQQLVKVFLYTTRRLSHLPAYQELWQRLRALPDFRRLVAATVPEPSPSPSNVFSLRHSQLGLLTLRTAPMVFSHVKSDCIVSYLPANQQTLHVYQHCHWQPEMIPTGELTLNRFA